MNWNDMNQSGSEDSNGDSPQFLKKESNSKQSRPNNQRQSQQPIDRMNNRRKYRDNPTPTTYKKQEKETGDREKKFLSDQEILKQIQDGTIKQNKSIRVVNCKLQALKNMLKQDKTIDLHEFKQHCYYANFKRKEDLLNFIRKKIQNKYKFFLHPNIKSNFAKGHQSQERKQSRNADKNEQKVQRQIERLDTDNDKGFSYTKDRSFLWKDNQFIIATPDANVQRLMKSLQNRKILDQFICLKINVRKDTVNIGYQFAKAVQDKYNWKADIKIEDIVSRLEAQKQVQITLKQGNKKKEAKNDVQKKQDKKQVQRPHEDKYAKKKYVNKYQDKEKDRDKQKQKQKEKQKEKQKQKQKSQYKEAFSLKDNIVFIYDRNVKIQDVLKAIKDQKVISGFLNIKVNITKDVVDTGFQVAEAIKQSLGWTIISKKENTLKFLQTHRDGDILIKQLTNKNYTQAKVTSKRDQRQPREKPKYVKKEQEKKIGFQLNSNTLHIYSQQASIKQISSTLEKSKTLKQFDKIRIKTSKKLMNFAQKVADNLHQVFGLIQTEKKALDEQVDEIIQVILEVGKKTSGKKIYVQKNTQIASQSSIRGQAQQPKKNNMVGKPRKIDNNADKFFQQLNSTNVSQIVQKIDQKEYCQKFRKHIHQIYEKYECWVIEASNQLIENLLRLSWKLKKYIQVEVQYRVTRQKETSKAFATIYISQKVLTKEKQRQDRPKVDTSYINSYLTNT